MPCSCPLPSRRHGEGLPMPGCRRRISRAPFLVLGRKSGLVCTRAEQTRMRASHSKITRTSTVIAIRMVIFATHLSRLLDPIFLHRLDLMFGREDRKSCYRHRSLGHGTFPGQIQPPPITSAGPCRNDGWRSADQVPRHLFVQGDPVSGWVHGPKDDVFEDRVRFLFPGL